MRAVQLPWRPYVFRTYFDTALMLSESKGMISHAYQQFWMGHTGDIEAQLWARVEGGRERGKNWAILAERSDSRDIPFLREKW